MIHGVSIEDGCETSHQGGELNSPNAAILPSSAFAVSRSFLERHTPTLRDQPSVAAIHGREVLCRRWTREKRHDRIVTRPD